MCHHTRLLIYSLNVPVCYLVPAYLCPISCPGHKTLQFKEEEEEEEGEEEREEEGEGKREEEGEEKG